MDNYEKILKEYEKAEKKLDAIKQGIEIIKARLEEEKKKIVIPCECGHHQVVGEIELICELYKWQNSSDPEDGCYPCYQYYYVCPKCNNTLGIPKQDLFTNLQARECWINGAAHPVFLKYVKRVHQWASRPGPNTRYCEPEGRVKELMSVHLEREARAEKEKERQRKIDQANRLLREAEAMQ